MTSNHKNEKLTAKKLGIGIDDINFFKFLFPSSFSPSCTLSSNCSTFALITEMNSWKKRGVDHCLKFEIYI